MEMKQPTKFVKFARKIYHPLGFRKGYNFILFFIFAGALFGFTLARFSYINFNGVFCNPSNPGGTGAAPGECYWYKSFRRLNVGIILHLGCILPASLLAVFQFIPIIRYKAILYHRIAGYVIFLLVAVSQAGVLMIAAHTFGGDNATRGWIGALVILTTTALALAYYNIKRLQIDQHRAWMIRAWFYFACIITLRLIMITGSLISANFKGAIVHVAKPCAEILFTYGGHVHPAAVAFPVCNATGFSPDTWVAVAANFNGDGPVTVGAALDAFFAMAGWIALGLHAIGVEVYLKLTPRESERLRQVSYERQLARGMKRPGSAGLVAERLGDADEWVPKTEKKDSISSSSDDDDKTIASDNTDLERKEASDADVV